MPTALVISYYFPPAGGPGVQRVAKHVKFLREFGWEPVVLAAGEQDYDGRSELRMPRDESLAREVPAGIEVHRIGSRQPFRLFRWLTRRRLDYLRELVCVPDSALTWIAPVVAQARRIAQRREIDLIYTSVKPHSTAVAGWLVKRALGRPWVLDFRDPWTQYFLATFPTRFHYWLERRLERFLLRRADHVITISPTARENLLEWCDFLAPERVSCITNGYDEEDFDSAAAARNDSTGAFTLVYTGVFCGAPAVNGAAHPLERAWRGLRRRLAYTPRSFDRLTHSPKYLLDALRELFQERPELRGKLRLLHVGPFDEANERYMRQLGIEGAVESRGYVGHDEVVRILRSADALFFCLADSPAGERNDCVPQKVYEYLGSRRPILALVPAGDARDFLSRAGTAVLCAPRDLSEIKAGLLHLIDGAGGLQPNAPFIERFKRRTLTAQLAEIFDRVRGLDRRKK